MVLIKYNYLKSDIFFNPIFIPGFSGSRFFRVQVFRVPVQGPGPGSGFRVRVQVLEVAGKNNNLKKTREGTAIAIRKKCRKYEKLISF